MLTYGPLRPRFAFGDWNLPAILMHHARERPDATFLRWTHDGDGISYRETLETVGRLAAGLREAGITEGDRVALYMRNSLEHVWCWFALNVLGAVDAPINPALFGNLLAHQVNLVRPKAVICDASMLPRLDDVLASLEPALHPTIIVNGTTGSREGVISLQTLQNIGFIEPGPRDPRSTATILYTSGTTGPSKGVTMPHAQVYFYSDQTAAIHDSDDRDIYLAPFPLFHASARVHGVYPALISGGSCVLYDQFSGRHFAERCAKSGGTITNALGSMIKMILDQPPSPYDAQCRLRCVMAVPTPFSTINEFQARFGVRDIVEVIGMTETSWPIMTPRDALRPRGAAGLLVEEWFDAQIVDPETDLPVEPGVTGELVVRPKHPWIMSTGYENMPEKTVEACRNLWFHTGDLARQDDDGWFYFVDRLKDSIRRRGENISSFEIEEAVLAFAGVTDAAAVAHVSPGEERDEEVLLFLTCESGGAVTAEALHAHLAARLPRFAIPRFVRIVEDFPRTQSGKVQKRELRMMGLGGPYWDLTAVAGPPRDSVRSSKEAAR